MEKTVNAIKARQNLGQILEEVYYKGDHYIVERAGKPMAAVVPVSQYLQWKERRDRFFAMIEEAQQRNKDTPPDVIEREVAEAIREVRASRAKSPNEERQ